MTVLGLARVCGMRLPICREMKPQNGTHDVNFMYIYVHNHIYVYYIHMYVRACVNSYRQIYILLLCR